MTTLAHNAVQASSPGFWKHAPPRLDEHVLVREHLLEKLDRSLLIRDPREHPRDVVFVVAPAGYGKTTLLGQWAQRNRASVTWYNLEASDDDPITLLRGLVAALRTRAPRSVWQVERLLGQPHAGALSAADLQRAIALLLADLRTNLGRRPHVLILTGVCDLSAQLGGHAVLNDLVARPADNLRIVLECREQPTLQVAQLITQRRVSGLSSADLRLRDEEVEVLLALHGVQLEPERLAALCALCDGWITGVLLATGAILPDFLQQWSADNFDRERVLEYLSQEVIDRLPSTLQDFAIEASVLDHMAPEVCAELLEISDAHERLVALEQRTGFMLRTGQPADARYRFQPFLRQALLARLETCQGGSGRRRTLHLKAGQIFEEMGAYEQAVQQFAAADAFARVIRLIEARSATLRRRGEGVTLARWIDLLPATLRRRTPWLQVLRAELFRLTGPIAEAEALVSQVAEAWPRLEADEPRTAAELLVVEGGLAFQAGRHKQAHQCALRARALVPKEASELQARAGLLLVSATGNVEGPSAGLARAEEVMRECAAVRDMWALAFLHYLRSKLFLLEGRYAEAESSATAALLHAEEATDEVTAVNARLNLGAIAARGLRVAQAREQFERAQAQAIAAGYVRGEAYALANLADIPLTMGKFDEAVGAYEQAWHAVTVLKTGDAHLRACIARNYGTTLAMLGQAGKAVELLSPEVEMVGAHGHDIDWVEVAMALGFARLRAGQPARARDILVEVCAGAQQLDEAVKTARAQLFLAAAELGLNEPEQARASLRAALNILDVVGDPDVVDFEVRLCPELGLLLTEMPHPIALTLLQRLANWVPDDASAEANTSEPARAAGVPSDRQHDHQDPFSATLRLYALGEPRVFLGTERVRNWRKPGVRDLLFLLADRGERGASSEQILAALWPDEEPAKAKALYREARSRLKAALGLTDCLAHEGERWRLGCDYWTDTQESERLLGRGEQLAHAGKRTEAVAVLRQALSYWAGPYLEDLYSDWPLQRRDELQRRYCDTLERLADLELHLGHSVEAAQHYYAMLDIEPHCEGAHRGLMRYFEAQGDISRALEQYQTLTRRLQQELGIKPSRETWELYRWLRKKATSADEASSTSYLSDARGA